MQKSKLADISEMLHPQCSSYTSLDLVQFARTELDDHRAVFESTSRILAAPLKAASDLLVASLRSCIVIHE